MKLMFRSFAVGLALLTAAAAASGAAAVLIDGFFGEVVDPAGDASRNPSDPSSNPAPDLIYASATVSGENLVLSAGFAPGTFDGDTSVTFYLDTDRNPSTGFPGTTSPPLHDEGVIGIEYILTAPGSNFGSEARLIEFTGPPLTSFAVVATDIPVTYESDGVEMTLPLAIVGGDPRLHFKVVVVVQISSVSNWGISDFMPDTGLQPGTTVATDEEITDLAGAIEDLESGGTLNHGPARALGNHLENALRSLEAGHEAAARAQLEAFIEQVQDLVADGALTEDEAAPLLGAAERALAGI